jgi:spore germination cell wall hydrolase CwlJ-like protein
MGGAIPRIFAAMMVAAVPITLAGCSGRAPSGETAAMTGTPTERDCLVRAMYFESNRSSQEGLMAVGTVVMNRVESRRFPNTICGVVGQHRQFASGVLARRLDPNQAGAATRAADAVLKGERYAPIGKAMHFHVASYKNPYKAQYVAVAGGNAFYLKPGRRWQKEYTRPVASVGEGPVRSLVHRATAIASSAQPASACDSATSPAATSMACESEVEGR